jgi:hypothetical protein
VHVDQVSGELEKVARGLSRSRGQSSTSTEPGDRRPLQRDRGCPEQHQRRDRTALAKGNFQDGSELCVRARVGVVEYPDGTCVTIHA